MENKRKAGILMPISALPAPYGIGSLGQSAYRFIDWLKESGMKIWQVLPLLPTNYGDSPYQACASNALNHYFIDFDLLAEEGLLLPSEYRSVDWGTNGKRVDYGKLFSHRVSVLKLAFFRFDKEKAEWKDFLSRGAYADYAVFMSLKTRFGNKPWTEWGEYREYDAAKEKDYIAAHREEFEFWQFTQYLFLKQWNSLKAYAHINGVEIMGDMPIYVAADSVEMWKYRKELFLLDGEGNCAFVAGVPPDAFSDEGQLWGNPVYNWNEMKKSGYRWWKERIDYALELFDIVRIDHFRGFDRFYAIPAGSGNAKRGEWLDGPKAALFEGLESSPIVAEDLGIIDDGVRALLKKTGYPGMKVIEFAFDGNPENEYKPSRYREHCIAYTGTHDNEPLRFYIENLSDTEKKKFDGDLERECRLGKVPLRAKTPAAECKTVMRLLFASRADVVILPLHDVLCLGKEARINFPSTVSTENWSYRFEKRDLKKSAQIWLKRLTEKYDR